MELTKKQIAWKKWFEKNKEYRREYNRRFMKENWKRWKKTKEQSRRDTKAWYWRNPEHARLIARRWRQRNKNKVSEYSKKYRKEHPEWTRLVKKTDKSNSYGLGKVTLKQIKSVYDTNIKKFGKLTCEICIRKINKKEDSIDHKKPISKGGLNTIKNIQITHLKCNMIKYNKP